MKLIRIAFVSVVTTFAAVSAHAQYGCYEGNLNGKFVVEGGGKKVTLDLLGAVTLEQEHNTIGYIVLDGTGNVTDGKIEEEVDNTMTEHTGVTGTYTLSGNLCAGTLTVQAAGYHRTFALTVTSLDPAKGIAGAFSLLPNGGNGEDEVYTADQMTDPSTVEMAARAPMSSLTPNATGGCTADMLIGNSFSGTLDGGTGGNVTKGTFKATFFDSGAGPQVTWYEADISNGALQTPTSNVYKAVVNPDCSVEIDSGTTKIAEALLGKKVSITGLNSVPLTDMVWIAPRGEWGKGVWSTW